MGDNIQVNSELEEQLKLTNLPPEICEHICQMLPSLSLYSLPTISNEFATFANKEMQLRHKKMEERQMMIMTESQSSSTIFNTISMLCPGLVMLYNSLSGSKEQDNNNNTNKCPVTGKHTIALHMQKSLFTTTNDRLSQCILTTHFSNRCPMMSKKEKKAKQTHPKCYKIVSEAPSEDSTPVVLITLPVNVNHFRKIRNSNPWNIIHSNKSVTDILGNVSVTQVTLPKEHLKAQFKLVKEVLHEELDVGLYFNTDLMESPNMYEDMDTFVLVLSDPTSDNSVHHMLESFFAKIFKPLKVSWIRIVDEGVKNSTVVNEYIQNILNPPPENAEEIEAPVN